MERRKYKNPPIEEALCEVIFTPRGEWDISWPWRIHDALKGTYDGKPRELSVMEAGLQSTRSGASVRVQGQAPKVQFLSQDGLNVATIGRYQFSVHRLRPYSEWEDLRARLLTCLRTYCDVAGPEAVRRIGLRYINKVTVPGAHVNFNEYLRLGLIWPDGLPPQMRHFIIRTESSYPDDPTKLLLTCTPADSPSGTCAILLDLDIVREWPVESPLSPADVAAAIHELKVRHRLAFETLLQEKTRTLLDAG